MCTEADADRAGNRKAVARAPGKGRYRSPLPSIDIAKGVCYTDTVPVFRHRMPQNRPDVFSPDPGSWRFFRWGRRPSAG